MRLFFVFLGFMSIICFVVLADRYYIDDASIIDDYFVDGFYFSDCDTLCPTEYSLNISVSGDFDTVAQFFLYEMLYGREVLVSSTSIFMDYGEKVLFRNPKPFAEYRCQFSVAFDQYDTVYDCPDMSSILLSNYCVNGDAAPISDDAYYSLYSYALGSSSDRYYHACSSCDVGFTLVPSEYDNYVCSGESYTCDNGIAEDGSGSGILCSSCDSGYFLTDSGACELPFYIADNGVTVVCDYAMMGDSYSFFDYMPSVTYFKRSIDEITAENAASSCTSGITDMSYKFSFYEDAAFPDDFRIAHWDTSDVVNMVSMFSHSYLFNADLSSWDVSNVLTMQGMFSFAGLFVSDLSEWDTSSVVDMHGMFDGASLFNSNVGSWNTSSVVDMSRMFSNAISFEQNLSAWDVSNVVDMGYMFAGVPHVFHVSVWDVSSVRSMRGMFYEARAIDLDIGIWDVSSVVDMSSMFSYVSSVPDVSLWDVSNVSSMFGMFYHVPSYSYDLFDWDVSSVKSCSHFASDISFHYPYPKFSLCEV